VRRFGRQAEGDRSQYVDIGKIGDELIGQNDRAPPGFGRNGHLLRRDPCRYRHIGFGSLLPSGSFHPNLGSRDVCHNTPWMVPRGTGQAKSRLRDTFAKFQNGIEASFAKALPLVI
jgi:hypothetical protein